MQKLKAVYPVFNGRFHYCKKWGETSMELKTERLIIREASYEDTKKISEQNNANSAGNFLASLSEEDKEIIFKDTDAVSGLLTRFSNSIGDGSSEIYGAWKKETLIGFISLVNVDSGTPEIQIEIAPKYQHKGYGYEFLFAVMEYIFEKQRFDYVRYTVLPNNDASIALVKSIGAFLQEPKSDVEKLLIQTYHISKLSMDAYQAHSFSNNHKPELEKDAVCGCFCCGKIFSPSEIEEWIIVNNPCDKRGTAICPHCSVDSVIGESSGYPITDEFMKAMNIIWCNGSM